MAEPRKRLTVAILALGGQGGGVLADWLTALGEAGGYFTQATSVPGVAQRTGSTVYYLELFPLTDAQPVLALTPAPGDVDVVVAAELMEAGRAMLRGFVTKDRTTLITSTHRIYAIAEKSAISGGLADSSKVLDAAQKNAKALVAFDMDAAANRTGSAISAVMLGAIAASGVLPFSREAYEDAIRAGGIAVEANLKGFAAGFEGREVPVQPAPDLDVDDIVAEGVRRLTGYQDKDYAALYLERLKPFEGELRREMARALALWMAYEDVIRVAQQKLRKTRMDEVRAHVNAKPDQILHVIEYMHPRWEELCDTLPAGLGERLARARLLKRVFAPMFEKGRHVRTNSVGWFLILRLLASRRRARRGTRRYAQENARIEAWLALVRDAAASNYESAIELAKCQNLIKGYGETQARGLRKFASVTDSWQMLRARPDAARILRELRETALRDEDGTSLAEAMRKLA